MPLVSDYGNTAGDSDRMIPIPTNGASGFSSKPSR